MSTTTRMRKAWHPPCKIRPARFTFHSGVAVTVDVRTLAVWERVDDIMAIHRYYPRNGQTWGYACRKITGGTGHSLHAFGIAVDVNSLSNPYGRKLVTDMPMAMVEAIEAITTVDGVPVVGWGGRYSKNKDAMHFEVICTPAELARGLRGSPLPEEDDMPLTDEDVVKVAGAVATALRKDLDRIHKSHANDSDFRADVAKILNLDPKKYVG